MGVPPLGPEPDRLALVAQPAATVVLLRDTVDGLEVLLLQRDSELAFANGMWVFPGGRVDPDDFPPGVSPEDPGALLDAAMNAAVREAGEEAGLAVDRDGLVQFAHWTTPPGQRRRFSTWFFLASAPSGSIVIDDGEIRDHHWARPPDALASHGSGTIALMPPTWVTLHWLAPMGGVEEALGRAREREPDILVPRPERIEGGIASLWEGDAGYVDGDVDRPGPRHRLVMPRVGPWRLERDL
jgi:8-oxo-dGTP pyrophosphatase MutT (NUDIX family)